AENSITGEIRHTSSAYLTFVALGPDGKPTQVPELILDTDDDRRRNQEAIMRRKARLELRRKEEQCKRDGICPI
ncbi:MAG: acyl-CoA thioesterase, partial [Dissulfurispiraceae bacterium]